MLTHLQRAAALRSVGKLIAEPLQLNIDRLNAFLLAETCTAGTLLKNRVHTFLLLLCRQVSPCAVAPHCGATALLEGWCDYQKTDAINQRNPKCQNTGAIRPVPAIFCVPPVYRANVYAKYW